MSGDDAEEQEATELAAAITRLLLKTSEESRFHLKTAIGAAEFSGVGGDLVIRIPRKKGEHPLVKWVGGGVTRFEV